MEDRRRKEWAETRKRLGWVLGCCQTPRERLLVLSAFKMGMERAQELLAEAGSSLPMPEYPREGRNDSRASQGPTREARAWGYSG